MNEFIYFCLLAFIAYMIGNITFARVVAKINHDDITKYGSGNPGTLNTWRAFGFWAGLCTFVLDMAKGFLVTLFGYLLFKYNDLNAEVAIYIAGFFVVLGHIFPIIFQFKGGKGIATSIGVFLVANWLVALISLVVMIVAMLFVKYASLVDLAYVLVLSIVEICLCDPINWLNYVLICGILFLVFYAHRGNIKRIFYGTENKTELLMMIKNIGKKK